MSSEQAEQMLVALSGISTQLDLLNTALIASVTASRWLFLALLVVVFSTLFQALKR